MDSDKSFEISLLWIPETSIMILKTFCLGQNRLFHLIDTNLIFDMKINKKRRTSETYI